MNFIGIDLGTHGVKAAFLDDLGNPKVLTTDTGEPMLRSVVYFEDNGNILVGAEAENAGLVDPSRSVANWKRHMGTEEVLYKAPSGKEYRAKDICAILSGKMKKIYEQRAPGRS